MRAISLPANLLGVASRQLGVASRQLGVASRQLGEPPRRVFLGDIVMNALTGDVVGDTGDVSSLPSDYSAGIANGTYYVATGTGASPPAAVPGDTGSSGPASFLTSITSALPALSSFITAEQLAQVNVQRARQGLPALQTSQYAPQVGVNIAPATMKPILIGAVAIAALIILRKRKG